jgi:hypothetical protein
MATGYLAAQDQAKLRIGDRVMKTVKNNTRAPIKVPLPRGKSLHLGPGKSGQIRDEDAEHAALKKLVEAGDVEIVGAGQHDEAHAADTSPLHQQTQGHARSTVRQRKGDR